MNRSTLLISAVSIGTLTLAGCGDSQPDDSQLVETPPATEIQEPVQQPELEQQGDDLQTRLVDHLGRARSADASQFRQMWPEHERLVNEMLDDCRQMMQQMGMTPPRQFTQVEEALENDLETFPDLENEELEPLLPDHLDRVEAVIDMRQDMMDMQ